MITVRGVPATSIPSVLRRGAAELPRHVFICVADHYEPKWQAADIATQRARVGKWVGEYPRSVEGIADSAGRPPQHTFFYPEEEYESEHLERLSELCSRGFGAVEVHLHHDRDTSEELCRRLVCFRERLAAHGLLDKDHNGRVTYGFIHGNWALDNSHPQGRHCGVNDELTILRATGCYADFTMPSAPACCQTRMVNSIYYAIDDPIRPKSHDRGVPAAVGAPPPTEGLLMIQGPLVADWSRRKFGVLPGLENGDLQANHPPTLERWKLWLRAGVHVRGRSDWVFVKLHTHGAQENNSAMLLGTPMRNFHEAIAKWAAEHSVCKYYYVTAREMAQLVHQAELGATEPRFRVGAR
ncbi:MAG: hypothetical protein WD894_11770 [Pirellulales bacterium]